MNWNIKGCSDQCVNCKKTFLDGEMYSCRLFLIEDGPRREDYCKDCWENHKNGSGAKAYSFWQGRFKAEPEPIEENVIEEPLLKRLLKKWIDSKERLHQCFCYVLALMLERKKIFKLRPPVSNAPGDEQMVYEDKETGETYILDNPKLTLAELHEIEHDLHILMDREFKIEK